MSDDGTFAAGRGYLPVGRLCARGEAMRWPALLLIIVLGFASALPAAEKDAAVPPTHGNFAAEKITVGDATREYRLVVPKSVDLKKPAPLVFAFHGFLI